MKQSALDAIKVAAGHKPAAVPASPTNGRKAAPELVFIGGQFPPEVRKALKLAEAYSGKNLKQLLSKAFNSICVEWKVPAPCADEE
jgi:hypothetical protein